MNWPSLSTPSALPTLRTLVLGPLNSGKTSLISYISQTKPTPQSSLLNLTLAQLDSVYLEFIEVSSRLGPLSTSSLIPSADWIIVTLDCQDFTSIHRVKEMLEPLEKYITQPITIALMKGGVEPDLDALKSMFDITVVRTDIYGTLDLKTWNGVVKTVLNQKGRKRENISVFLG